MTIAWIVFGIMCTGAFGETNLLEKAQANYEEKHAAIEDDHKTALAGLKVKYLKGLQGAETSASKEGNLERLIALRSEIGLLEGKPPTPDAVPDAFVKKVQGAYQEKIKEADEAMEAKEKVLRGKFVAYLGTLVTQQTKDSQIEAAMETRSLIKRVAATPMNRAISFGEEPQVASLPPAPARGFPPLTFPSRPIAGGFPPRTPFSTDPSTPKSSLPANPGPGIPANLKGSTLFYLGFENSPKAGPARGDGPRQKPCLIMGNPEYAPGPRGLALKLNKKEDYIRVMPFILGREITLSGWVRYDKWPGWGHIIKFGDENKLAEIAIYTNGDGKHLMAAMSGGGQDNSYLEAFNEVQLGTWMHIIATCDQHGTMRLYKNGKLLKQGQRRNGISPHPRRFVQIGRDFNEQGARANQGVYGMVDEVLVLSRAISLEEAAELYKWFGGK